MVKVMKNNEQTKFAGFWVRLGSVAIDALFITVMGVIGTILCIRVIHSLFSTGAFLVFTIFFGLGLSFLITLFYFAWFNAEGRQSPGKKLFGIAVVDTGFKPIPFSQSLLRAFFYFVDTLFLGIGHFTIIFNRKKKAFHDIVAKTIVIRRKPKIRFEPFLIIFVLIGGYFIKEGVIVYFRTYVKAYRIPTGSFKPTILVGDFILVDKYWPKNNSPETGDVIVFKYPQDERVDYIERCIAVGGQTVEIRNNQVYIDGRPEGESQFLGQEYDFEEGRFVKNTRIKTANGKTYIIRHYTDFSYQENYGPVTVPEGHYFVLGDNRDNSADSRSWGFLPQKNIVGKAGLIYFSWDKAASEVRWSRIGKVLE